MLKFYFAVTDMNPESDFSQTGFISVRRNPQTENPQGSTYHHQPSRLIASN